MTQADFGVWMAEQINATQPETLQQVRPYTRQKVNAWESGQLSVPAKAELVLLRRQLADKDAEIQKLRQRRRQKPKQ